MATEDENETLLEVASILRDAAKLLRKWDWAATAEDLEGKALELQYWARYGD